MLNVVMLGVDFVWELPTERSIIGEHCSDAKCLPVSNALAYLAREAKKFCNIFSPNLLQNCFPGSEKNLRAFAKKNLTNPKCPNLSHKIFKNILVNVRNAQPNLSVIYVRT